MFNKIKMFVKSIFKRKEKSPILDAGKWYTSDSIDENK